MVEKNWNDKTLEDGDVVPTHEWIEMTNYIESVIESSGVANPTTLKVGGNEITVTPSEINDVVGDTTRRDATRISYMTGYTEWLENVDEEVNKFVVSTDTVFILERIECISKDGTSNNNVVVTVSSSSDSETVTMGESKTGLQKSFGQSNDVSVQFNNGTPSDIQALITVVGRIEDESSSS